MRLDAPESPLGDVVFSTASSSSPHSVASSSSSRPLGVTSLLKGAMESDHEEGELLMQSETIPPRAFVGTPSLHNTPSEQTSADHAGKTRRVSRPLQRILRRSGNSTGYRSRALTPIILAVLSACLVSLKLFYLACVRSTNMTLPASTSSSSSSLEFASRLLPRFRASPFSSGSDDAGSSIRRLADSQGGAPNQGMPRNSELCHTGEGSGEEGPEQRASGENLARNEESPVQPSTGRELRGQARQELGEQETDDTVPTQGGGCKATRIVVLLSPCTCKVTAFVAFKVLVICSRANNVIPGHMLYGLYWPFASSYPRYLGYFGVHSSVEPRQAFPVSTFLGRSALVPFFSFSSPNAWWNATEKSLLLRLLQLCLNCFVVSSPRRSYPFPRPLSLATRSPLHRALHKPWSLCRMRVLVSFFSSNFHHLPGLFRLMRSALFVRIYCV
uniref:Uncharacterized protein n=1 Tax=Toxoplasma gondii (strain ATCC 50861 / VEG) TaxID=432359 RepID=A0A0F7V191_TOXGV|nr:TPA: hypothetical protein BN1205_076610 [Toxoplasma gondii VEG]